MMSDAENSHRSTALPLQSPEQWKRENVDAYARSPFVHKFETERNKYVYDVNSMKIICVDPVVWAIVSDVGGMHKDRIVEKYSLLYPAEKVALAHDEIVKAQQHRSLFLPNRPKIEFPLSEQDLRVKLNSERMLLLLNVTENCNFRCSYCVYSGKYINRHARSERQMNWSTAKLAIDDFLEHSSGSRFRSIGFYGGEPLLNLELIRKCAGYVRGSERGAGVDFSLTTNGSLLAGEAADFLADVGMKMLVSLDGPQNLHDRYRRHKNGSPTWQRVTSNVAAFLESHPEYRTNGQLGFATALAPPLDVRDLDRFFASLDWSTKGMRIALANIDPVGAKEPLEGDIVGLEPIYRSFVDSLATGAINDDPFDPRYRLQRELFEAPWLKFHKRFERSVCPQHGVVPFQDTFCSFSTCIPGRRRTFVGVDGSYWPCERVAESDYFRIGNVKEGLDIPAIRRLLNEWVGFTQNECKFCWLLRTCQVGCWSRVSDGARATALLKRKACAAHRREAHSLLVDYCSVLEKNPTALEYMRSIVIG